MKLVEDWKDVILHSHSFRALVLAVLLMVGVETTYRLTGIDLPPPLVFGGLFGLLIYGAVGRLVSQRDDGGRLRVGSFWKFVAAGVAFLLALNMLLGMGEIPKDDPEPAVAVGPPSEAEWAAVAVPLVAKWEGLRTHAYLDTLAEPDVWTVCYGETRNVGPGDVYTAEECAAKLRARLREYRAGWHSYLTDETLAYRLTPERDAAYTSLAYNVGQAGAGRSTATRRLNAGDIRGGCIAIGWWNKAGGRVWAGLVNRRAEETALCLVGTHRGLMKRREEEARIGMVGV